MIISNAEKSRAVTGTNIAATSSWTATEHGSGKGHSQHAKAQIQNTDEICAKTKTCTKYYEYWLHSSVHATNPCHGETMVFKKGWGMSMASRSNSASVVE